jgi:hypothetical protein
MSERPSLDGTMRTDPSLARWARWRTGGSSRLVDAVRIGGGRPTAFSPGQVLIDSADRSLVRFLMERHDAQLLPPLRLPPPPPGLKRRTETGNPAMPLPIRLQVRNPPPLSMKANEVVRAGVGDKVSVSSSPAAGLLGLVAELAREGSIGLDFLGHSSALPLLSASDPLITPPFQVDAYAKRSRVCAAWQLVEAYRQVKAVKDPVTIAVLDGGFWLNGRTPGVAPMQAASDFGGSIYQLNLLDEDVGAGGANPNKCDDGYTCPWHGNAVASVAAARVDNGLGVAGVGGTVARPILLKSELSISQIIHAVNICFDWGVDVLNMSFAMSVDAEIWFPTQAWNSAFKFAADNGLIMVAAAGNGHSRLPDIHLRPATRTPGTITVGALDINNNATTYSNYGPSVDIWAPGDNVPVMPDPNNPNGSVQTGTSIAAPMVSGVAAMMRAVNPTIDNSRTRQILIDTGWKGSGDVGVGVDAFAAVLAAMGGQLPSEETVSNDSPATARKLRMISGGRLVPYELGLFFSLLSHVGDSDWYKFDVGEFSRFDLQASWYPLLGSVSVTLEPDDASSQALTELGTTTVPGAVRLLGLLAPGGYKLHVRGSINLYELTVDLKPEALQPDMFEPNDSFETATKFRVADPPKPWEVASVARVHGPGTYNLTLHTAGDRDFFRIEVAASANPLKVAVVRVARADAPLDVALLDSAHERLDHLDGVREGHLTLPTAASPFFFVHVSSKAPTRYVLTIRFEVDQAHVPGPHRRGSVIFTPDLGDPPFRVDSGMNHLLVDVNDARRAAGNLALASVEGAPIRADLLDSTGAFVTAAMPAGPGMHPSVELAVGDLLDGTYVLQISAAGPHVAAKKTRPLNVEVVPAIR